MWVPKHKHPLFDSSEQTKCRGRWEDSKTYKKNAYFEHVTSLIDQGAGKHFLNYAWYKGELPIIEDEFDLRGFSFWQLKKNFKDNSPTFKGIDFSYSKFMHCEFAEAEFFSCSLDFSRFYNCTFKNCAFGFTHLIGAIFEKCNFINCDFCEPCRWENGTFKNSAFEGCFLGETTPFSECFFDDLTKIDSIQMRSYRIGEKVFTPKAALSGYYASFQDAYQASGAEEKAMEYYWEGRKAFTRYNLTGLKRIISLGNELIAGYGIRPLRPLVILFIVYIIAVLGFSNKIPLIESITFSAGALFTFGATSEYLKEFGYVGRLLYVLTSFVGLFLSALFVTTLANLWFRSRIPSRTVKIR